MRAVFALLIVLGAAAVARADEKVDALERQMAAPDGLKHYVEGSRARSGSVGAPVSAAETSRLARPQASLREFSPGLSAAPGLDRANIPIWAASVPAPRRPARSIPASGALAAVGLLVVGYAGVKGLAGILSSGEPLPESPGVPPSFRPYSPAEPTIDAAPGPGIDLEPLPPEAAEDA